MSFDQSTIDEIKEKITDDNLEDEDLIEWGFEKSDIAEARRQLSGSNIADDERKEDSASEWSGEEDSSSESSFSASSSSSDSEDDSDKEQAEAKKELEDLQDKTTVDEEADAEYDNDLAVDDDEPFENVLEGLPPKLKFTNEQVKTNRDQIRQIQKDIYDSAPPMVQDVLLMMMRNGISNEWIRRYEPYTDLTKVINDAILQDEDEYVMYRRIKFDENRKEYYWRYNESPTWDPYTETDPNPYFETDVQLFDISTPGHLMALVKYWDKNGNIQSLLFDSNGTGEYLDKLANEGYGLNLGTITVVRAFAPHNKEFDSALARNIFIGTMGRCASWSLFILICFQGVIKMESGEELDNTINKITDFFEQFNGSRSMEHARVLSTLILGLYTRLQLWGTDKLWFREFRTSKQQAYLMPEFVKRSHKARRLWKKLKIYKARVKKETEDWLKRDTPFSGPVFAKMFGFQTSVSESDSRDIYSDTQKIARGGSVLLTSTRFKAEGTVLNLRMPLSPHFAPFDFLSGYYRRENDDSSYGVNERIWGSEGITTLKFGVVHQQIERKTGKQLEYITWREVLDYVKEQIARNKEYWARLNELTSFDATLLFEYDEEHKTVLYGDFKQKIYLDEDAPTIQKLDKAIEQGRLKGLEVKTSQKKEDYILHVQQDTMWGNMSTINTNTLDNNNWPVLLNKPFPFFFHSKFKDSETEYDEKLYLKRGATKPLKNQIYLTFDHATENRKVDFTYGQIFQRTEPFMNKEVVNGVSVNSHNRYKERHALGNNITHRPIPANWGKGDMTDEQLKEKRKQNGWVFSTRNKLKNYYRHSWAMYRFKFHRRMTIDQQLNYGGPLVSSNPRNLRFNIINSNGKYEHWVDYFRKNLDKNTQLEILYALKRAMNPQYERSATSDYFYPHWNEMRIASGERVVRQAYNLESFNGFKLYPVPSYLFKRKSGGQLVDMKNKRNQRRVKDFIPGPWNINDKVKFQLNYCFEVKWPQGSNVDLPNARIWTRLMVTGTIRNKVFESRTELPPKRDVFIVPPQWYYTVYVDKVQFWIGHLKPYRLEFLNLSRNRFVKGKWETVRGRGVYTDPDRSDLSVKKNLTLEQKRYLKKQFPGQIVVALNEDFFKAKPVIDLNNADPVVDLTGDEGSSSSVGKKRKKPGVFEKMENNFPKLKL